MAPADTVNNGASSFIIKRSSSLFIKIFLKRLQFSRKKTSERENIDEFLFIDWEYYYNLYCQTFFSAFLEGLLLSWGGEMLRNISSTIISIYEGKQKVMRLWVKHTHVYRGAQHLLIDPEVTANLYCNCAYPYCEGCVICSIYVR